MISKRSEKAIKAWLKLPTNQQGACVHLPATIELWRHARGDLYEAELIAKFTIASVVAKRGPKRKKKAVRK
jgi:hypothetical protein